MLIPALLLVAFLTAYFILGVVYGLFFDGRMPKFKAPWLSLATITTCVIAAFAAGLYLPDVELGNRIQHALGGFAAYLTCVLVVRDTGIRVTPLRFLLFSVLVATAMGVANELMEFVVQTHSHIIFNDNTLDTWRDLTSNTTGIMVALVITHPIARTFRANQK